MKRVTLLLLAALSVVSCDRSGRPDDALMQEFAVNVEGAAKSIVDGLDDLFQINMYLEADGEAAKEEIFEKYFGGDRYVEVDGNTVYLVLPWASYTINTGGLTLSQENAAWNISAEWYKAWADPNETYDLTVTRLSDNRYSVQGYFLKSNIFEETFLYSDVDLEFTTGLHAVGYLPSLESGFWEERNTVTYEFDGRVESYIGVDGVRGEGAPEYSMNFIKLYGYDAKRHICAEPLYTGRDYYFKGGNIECSVNSEDCAPGILYVSVGRNWEWSLDWRGM